MESNAPQMLLLVQIFHAMSLRIGCELGGVSVPLVHIGYRLVSKFLVRFQSHEVAPLMSISGWLELSMIVALCQPLPPSNAARQIHREDETEDREHQTHAARFAEDGGVPSQRRQAATVHLARSRVVIARPS